MNHSTIKRRKFITGMAAAALAPAIIPKSVLGLGADTAASDRITLGFIGVGKRGMGLLKSFLELPECQVIAVCDVDKNKLNRAKNSVQKFYTQKNNNVVCDAYRDFRQLLQRKDIDAVVIGTPDHWHAIPTMMAAESGKDIYCEKPMSLTIAEGQKMVQSVRKYERIFQTGSQQRSDYQFRFACELVRNHYIGAIKNIRVHLPHGWAVHPYICDLSAKPVPDELDWQMWLGPAPDRPFNPVLSPPITDNGWPKWRNYRDYSGGIMTDWGAHHFDIVQWALGTEKTGPVEIIPPKVRDNKFLTYRYANGILMTMESSKEIHNLIEFEGTEGVITASRGYLKVEPESLMKQIIRPDEIHLYQSKHHQKDWLQSIRTRTKPICDVEIGHCSASVCHLGNIAVQLNRPLNWDPQKEKFVNDIEANMHLSRPMRSPWHV